MRTVCCVMLANGREAMVRRAIRAWSEQTYEERYRTLLIFDSTPYDGAPEELTDYLLHRLTDYLLHRGLVRLMRPQAQGMPIGALRNNANRRTNADIILHWDSDDWSHPNRIAEQVALLEASGKEAVGYRDMLFWRTGSIVRHPSQMSAAALESGAAEEEQPGEAWLYTNRNPQYCLGTSLCYWREVWQRNPFPDTSAGEDTLWLRGVQSQGHMSINAIGDTLTPRMIASIHGGNTYARIEPRAEEWKRVPEWDAHCREVMAL